MRKRLLLGLIIATASTSASAADAIVAFSAEDSHVLRGKTIAQTLHKRPSFSAVTAGKASFGLIGLAATYKVGNSLIDKNGVSDPAILIREQTAAMLRDDFGAQLLPPDPSPADATKSADIAKLHPEADYVLDVRSTSWKYGHYPTSWGRYWVAYAAQLRLIDGKTGRQLINAGCDVNTRENPHPPSREQLHANGAALLKAVTAALGWTCMQTFAMDSLAVAPENIPTIPAQYQDPLAVAGMDPDAQHRVPAVSGTTESIATPAVPAERQETNSETRSMPQNRH